ncbi:helix-turn-helix domain-containing protein [Candidatus Gottesmanbacteria bacterium]|nr:helix-turn-helix domain-containing protein [Candidatus Gottesmanbacteria bacterium]
MIENDNEFYTVEEVAKLLQVHWQTILNYIKNGKIEAIKLGKGYRIQYTALNKFIKNNRTHGQFK